VKYSARICMRCAAVFVLLAFALDLRADAQRARSKRAGSTVVEVKGSETVPRSRLRPSFGACRNGPCGSIYGLRSGRTPETSSGAMWTAPQLEYGSRSD
jgi:hypothetical protein